MEFKDTFSKVMTYLVIIASSSGLLSFLFCIIDYYNYHQLPVINFLAIGLFFVMMICIVFALIYGLIKLINV